jgi:hypothetical protein
MSPQELAEVESYLTEDERAELMALIAADVKEKPWTPLPGPQTMAYESTADVVGFGGAAGGGKTDLAVGKAITNHQVVQIMRRDGTELGAIIDRMEQIVGHRNGLGGRPPVWRQPAGRCRLVEFGSAPNLGDEKKFQGRAKDLLVIDEAANWLEAQVRFLMGWVRTVDPKQRCQTLLTFNPPTSQEGRWLVAFFAPWLDPRHPMYPAQPGALKWVAMVDGKEQWLESGTPFEHKGELIRPSSRTFIPSRITDNPYLVGTNYMTTLQALPEPLRSQMLYGDFAAGMGEDPWQVIPTAWVEAAMARWKDKSPKGEMLSMGVDVARGGKDNTTIACKHEADGGGRWFDKIKTHKGSDTPDGPVVAGLVIGARRDDAPVAIDVIGVGASPYDTLKGMKVSALGVNVSEKSLATDRSGRLTFMNQRSELWWKMREALEPSYDKGLALPPDDDLKRELCAPRWKVSGRTIQVESREEIIDRIGYSPDRATAVILANIEIPKISHLTAASERDMVLDYNPLDRMRSTESATYDSRRYDPFER